MQMKALFTVAVLFLLGSGKYLFLVSIVPAQHVADTHLFTLNVYEIVQMIVACVYSALYYPWILGRQSKVCSAKCNLVPRLCVKCFFMFRILGEWHVFIHQIWRHQIHNCLWGHSLNEYLFLIAQEQLYNLAPSKLGIKPSLLSLSSLCVHVSLSRDRGAEIFWTVKDSEKRLHVGHTFVFIWRLSNEKKIYAALFHTRHAIECALLMCWATQTQTVDWQLGCSLNINC